MKRNLPHLSLSSLPALLLLGACAGPMQLTQTLPRCTETPPGAPANAPHPADKGPCIADIFFDKAPAAGEDTDTNTALAERRLPESTAAYLEFRSTDKGLDLPKPLADYFNCLDAAHQDCAHRPALAVSLEGGGSKTAPFSMGVLAGLHDAGLLESVEIVSSVSGGTYAAYHFFSRMMERGDPGASNDPEDWYLDCLPTEYQELFGTFKAHAELDAWCTAQAYDKSEYFDRYPYQFQVRTNVDLFGSRNSLRPRKPLDGTTYLFSTVTPDILAAPLYHVHHSLFDWNLNTSLSRKTYRDGIVRAYGTPPGHNDDDNIYRLDLRDLAIAYKFANSHLEKSGDGVRHGVFPLWILNTSVSSGRWLNEWTSPPLRDSLRYQFELTPIGFGSGSFGYVQATPQISVRDAVGTSAAFLDGQERLIGDIFPRRVAAFATWVLGSDWSSSFDNYRVPDSARIKHDFLPFPLYLNSQPITQQAPFLHGDDGGNVDNLGLLSLLRRGVQNIIISASTGDRPGAFPSLCAAKNQLEMDRRYALLMPELEAFDQLCNLQIDDPEAMSWPKDVPPPKVGARKLYCDRYQMPPVKWNQAACANPPCSCETAEQWVKPETYPVGYDLYHWQRPVLRGCVIARNNLQEPAPLPQSCECLGNDFRLLTRLYVIKPAIDVSHIGNGRTGQVFLPDIARDYGEMNGCMMPGASLYEKEVYIAKQPRRADIQRCAMNINARWYAMDVTALIPQNKRTDTQIQAFVSKTDRPGGTYMDIPCQSLAYLMENQCASDWEPKFPQDSMVGTTLSSDAQQFGAYFALGRYYAAQLTWAGSGSPELKVLAPQTTTPTPPWTIPACRKTPTCDNTCRLQMDPCSNTLKPCGEISAGAAECVEK